MNDIYQCPICGNGATDFYLRNGKIIGCDNCVDRKDPQDYADDQRDWDSERITMEEMR